MHAELSALALFPAQSLANLCIGHSQVSASSVQDKTAAPAVASGAKTCHPDALRINQDAATNSIVAMTEQLPAPADKHRKRSIAAACRLLVASLPESVLQKRCAAACQLFVASPPECLLNKTAHMACHLLKQTQPALNYCMHTLQVLSDPSAPSCAGCWLAQQPALHWESQYMSLLQQVCLPSEALAQSDRMISAGASDSA